MVGAFKLLYSSSPKLWSYCSSSNQLNTLFFSLFSFCLPRSLPQLRAKNNGANLTSERKTSRSTPLRPILRYFASISLNFFIYLMIRVKFCCIMVTCMISGCGLVWFVVDFVDLWLIFVDLWLWVSGLLVCWCVDELIYGLPWVSWFVGCCGFVGLWVCDLVWQWLSWVSGLPWVVSMEEVVWADFVVFVWDFMVALVLDWFRFLVVLGF